MIILPGGGRLKWNFRRGGGDLFWEPILENPEGEGVIGKIPSMGGYGYFLELHNIKFIRISATVLTYQGKN